ncbi:MAG: Multidrug resistance protein MdtB [Phycisphaerae bacterium]|nr:Multidrug resistance protein MdtB [Phycisphaerae bacterium]
MQKLAEICIRRPVFAVMLILSLVVFGGVSYFKLGVDRFPNIDLPVVRISTSLPGAAPEEVETQISDIIEEAVNTAEGIEELRSISGQGQSFVIVTFRLDRDIDAATQDVRDRVATALRRLPEDTDPPIISKSDNESTPVLSMALSGPLGPRELTDLAERVVKRRIERSKGVGQVDVSGGLDRTINVWVSADRLAAYQLPVTAVRDAIIRQNTDVPGGFITDPARERTLRTLGRILDPASFNDIVVETRGDAPIRLCDVAVVEDGTREERSASLLNGLPTVTLDVLRQSGANTIETIEAVKANLARVTEELPPGVRIDVIADQSRYIYAALHEINVHLIVGSALASLVVLVFMRNWRSTIIAAVAIPTSVIATFGVMWALDFTLNSVTMLGLVLMVGIVIDDAIVVLENIFRFIEEKGMAPFDAAREATREIGLAVLATTLSLVVIFVPVSFMSGISGRFLSQFGITAAAAVLVSLLVSFTLTPMMSARLLRPVASVSGETKSRRGFYHGIEAAYAASLRGAMRFRVPVLVLAGGVIASAVPLYRHVRQEYVPSNIDEAEFRVNVNAPEGTSFAAMRALMEQIDADLRATPGVTLVQSNAGSGFLGGVNQGRAYVQIEPHDERVFSLGRLWRATLAGDPMSAFRGNYSQRDVMQLVRTRLRAYPQVRAGVRNDFSLNLGGGPFEIDFAVRGAELDPLLKYAEELKTRAEAVGGFTDLDTSLRLDKPEIRVEVDRRRAADLGVDPQDIASALRTLVGGDNEVSRFRDPLVNEDYDVQLRLIETDRNAVELLNRIYVAGGGGRLVRLDSVATLTPSLAPSRIDRLDRQRQVSLRGGVAPGYALADRIAVLREESAKLGMPPGYSTLVSGRGRELERTYGEFALAFLLSIVFMYMVLAAQLESVLHPITIMLSLPLALPFGLFSLWVTSDTLNMYSALGLLVLFGIVKKNSILQINHIDQLREEGVDRAEAILQGSRDRLRPILMTTLSFVAGMLPLALGTGPGAEERRTIAIVIIGGQTLSLVLTLLVTPVAYAALEDAVAAVRRGFGSARSIPSRAGKIAADAPAADSGS